MSASSANTLQATAHLVAGIGGRRAGVAAFERGVVELFTQTAELLGIPKSVAAIYGILFASAGPLTFVQIEQKLELSKGSVSQGLRTLRDIGAVHEVSSKTERLASYAPDLEMRKLIQRFLRKRVDAHLAEVHCRLQRLDSAARAIAVKDRAELTARLKKLERWYSRVRQFSPFLTALAQLT